MKETTLVSCFVFAFACSDDKPPVTQPADTRIDLAGDVKDVRTIDMVDPKQDMSLDVRRDPDVGPMLPPDPGYPIFPETVGTLSVSIRTDAVDFAGTSDGTLQICLTESDCYLLDTVGGPADNLPWPNEFVAGEVDTFHLENVAFPRAGVDRVELRSTDGDDAYRPVCISVQFDGEPVHCNDTLDLWIGDNAGNGELTAFSDPDWPANFCTSCFGTPVTAGPLLGSVEESSANIWVRTDATRRVALEMANVATPDDWKVIAYQYPSAVDDFVTEFSVSGLVGGTEYRYRFDVDGIGTSNSYTMKTAPVPGGQQTRIAMGSCSRDYPAPIFSQIVASDPDLFIYLGDNHYANANYAGETDAERLAILRWHYRRSLMQTERAQLAASIPSLAIWDDHDYVGNNIGGDQPGRDPAFRAFKEYWANKSSGLENAPGIFSKKSYGYVDIFLLDTRYYRTPQDDAEGSLLGPAQTLWLKEELKNSTAVFKIIASGSLFSAAFESWTKVPGARADLFDFMGDNQISGVVLVSGDVHRSLIRRLPRTGTYSLPEIVSSPLNTGNSPCYDDDDAQEVVCEASGNYFVTLDIDTSKPDPTLIATIVRESGETLEPVEFKLSDLQ